QGGGMRVGGSDGLGTGRLHNDAEGVRALVGRAECVVGRQRGGGAAREVHRARVAGRHVAIRVEGGDGDVKGLSAADRAGRAGQGERAGGGRPDVHTRGGRGAGDAVDTRGQDDRVGPQGREAVRDRDTARAAERLVNDAVAVPVELEGVDGAHGGPA